MARGSMRLSSAGYFAVGALRLVPSLLNPIACFSCRECSQRAERRNESAGSSSADYIRVMYFCSTVQID